LSNFTLKDGCSLWGDPDLDLDPDSPRCLDLDSINTYAKHRVPVSVTVTPLTNGLLSK
jgi:hypothetical protein